MLEANTDEKKEALKEMGRLAWYTGLASNLDMKKVKFERWMEQFTSEQDNAARQQQQIEEGRELHMQMMEIDFSNRKHK